MSTEEYYDAQIKKFTDESLSKINEFYSQMIIDLSHIDGTILLKKIPDNHITSEILYELYQSYFKKASKYKDITELQIEIYQKIRNFDEKHLVEIVKYLLNKDCHLSIFLLQCIANDYINIFVNLFVEYNNQFTFSRIIEHYSDFYFFNILAININNETVIQILKNNSLSDKFKLILFKLACSGIKSNNLVKMFYGLIKNNIFNKNDIDDFVLYINTFSVKINKNSNLEVIALYVLTKFPSVIENINKYQITYRMYRTVVNIDHKYMPKIDDNNSYFYNRKLKRMIHKLKKVIIVHNRCCCNQCTLISIS